jgi:hypothetical protein
MDEGQGNSEMPETTAVIDSFHDAWNRYDVAGIAAILGVDGGYADPFMVGDLRGRRPDRALDATWTGANDKRFTRIEALRRGSLAMLIALSVQTGLGLTVNIYATIPKSDNGAGLVAAVGRAVSNGPIGLAIHGVFGLVLLVMSVSLLVRAVIARDRFFSSPLSWACYWYWARPLAAPTSSDTVTTPPPSLWANSQLPPKSSSSGSPYFVTRIEDHPKRNKKGGGLDYD